MSETDFLKLKKHDNVETNTEKFDIENYLNGNWDKIDENVGEVNTNISNINSKNKEQDTNIKQLQGNTETSSNKIAELEKELKEAQEDFYQNSIRGQASGEYIHVEDSSNCRARIGIGGNSEQKMRSGKNYLNTLAKYKAGEKVTVDGITYIFNEDGSITCNGTATADSVLTFSLGLQTINGSSKKIVGMLTGTQVPKKLSILAYTSDWSKNTFTLLSNVNKNITINMQENIDYTIFRIIAYKGTTLNNQTIYYQILDTSVNDLTYEQYGASPSPNYPSKVVAVGSNVNLFAGGDTVTNNGVTFTKNKDDSYDIVGMATEQANCINFVDIQNSGIINGNIYNIHVSENLPDGVKILIEAYNDAAWIRHVLGSSLIPNVSKANIENVNKIRFTLRVEKGISVNIHNLRIKLEKDTIETAYSKYGQGCVKVTKCNKNLFDKDKALQKYELNRTTGQIKSNDLFFTSDYIRVSPNKQYFLSGKNDGESNCFYDKNKKYIDAVVLKNGLLTVPDNSNIYYLRLNSRLTAIDTTMLEKNTKKSAYEEHQGQSYIMPTQQSFKSVGDIRDTFIKKDGKWYERHNIYRYLFTGNENFKALDNNSIFGMTVTENKAKIVSKNSGENLTNCLSNRFVNNTQSNTVKMSNKIAFSQWSDTQYLYLSKIKDSVDELKNYLAANETYVDYPLETPIDLECTEEQSKILDELNNARTYKNVTNITTDSKAILSLDYVKDQETQNQKMQNEIDEIKQLLSTTQTSALLLDNMQTDIESEVK